MTQDHTPPPQDPQAARRKLVGRAMVILLLGLVAIYVFFTFNGPG
jgi:hypothetical protein